MNSSKILAKSRCILERSLSKLGSNWFSILDVMLCMLFTVTRPYKSYSLDQQHIQDTGKISALFQLRWNCFCITDVIVMTKFILFKICINGVVAIDRFIKNINLKHMVRKNRIKAYNSKIIFKILVQLVLK